MIGCLLIHGYTGGPHELAPLIKNLKKNTNFQIEVPILPGHGETLELDDISYDKWLKASEESYHHLKEKVEKIYVIGFSMGGMIAAYLASKFNVDKLVLLATAGKYLSLRQLGMEVSEVIKDGLTGKLDENVFFQGYKKKMRVVPIKANIEFMKLVKETKKHLKHVDTPVLIIQGKLDSMVPYQTASFLAEEMASDYKEVVLFGQSKHQICLGDDRDTLNSMVYNFLTTQPKNTKNTEPTKA